MRKIYYLLFATLLISCNENKENEDATEQIVERSDIQKYLDLPMPTRDADQRTADSLGAISTNDPTKILTSDKVAGMYDRLFDTYATVEDLNKSVRYRESVVRNRAIKPEGAKRALAQAYIKQHRFKMADSLMKSFTSEYASRNSKLVMFDVAMELGRYEEAENLLDELQNENDYNYLIRAAKWNDYKGKLDNTIMHMEKALKLAEESGNKSYKLWCYSNIADYYGHDGQIEESYNSYLKTLELDPDNNYALKGIAWIAYSHDKNTELAMDILSTLYDRHPSPDYLALMAEIKEYNGELEEADRLMDTYLDKINNPAYGNMYNTYLIEELVQGNENHRGQALSIAKEEIGNRATPETYDLLGYALLLNDQKEAALENHKEHVIGKTFEPVAAYHSALIYKANGMEEAAAELKEELMEAGYELGPVMLEEIKRI